LSGLLTIRSDVFLKSSSFIRSKKHLTDLTSGTRSTFFIIYTGVFSFMRVVSAWSENTPVIGGYSQYYFAFSWGCRDDVVAFLR
jgi:hypothetical protein